MEISYTTPLRRAWQHMQAMLFRPLLVERWLVIGFAAFVANLLSTGGGLFGWNNGFPSRHSSRAYPPGAEHAFEAVHDHAMALLAKPVVLLAIAIGLAVFGVILLVFAWASARARFVFLDNVVTGQGEFVEPWRRNGRLGRSLFLWCAGFSFCWLLPLGAAAYPFLHTIGDAIRGLGYTRPAFDAIVLAVLTAVLLALVLSFVAFLTHEFVVPLMMMHDEGATRAWGRFWPLLTSHPGEFIAYTLFVAVVWTGVCVALLVAGVATCCIGLGLMVIPYIGTVLTLPLEVTARAYGPWFLAQFGPEWDLFASRAASPEEPARPLLG